MHISVNNLCYLIHKCQDLITQLLSDEFEVMYVTKSDYGIYPYPRYERVDCTSTILHVQVGPDDPR
eukprot:CAMPEP_0119049104 /NCGR_PEP_ID=MMETSP1177-20130426/62781_1 /TAXON_ID=2985 /ORGANISM="Ochromonas sp, Strain CCMP1899" /LENGTH=65 /DNA_ID=CAMNT_0007025895 /DNA_START=1467 /DNA_END=1661 /DNA_ORIENTATION=+